jgi:hypothetical protein
MEIDRIGKLTERLDNVQRIFLDTAPVIYYVEKNKDYFSLVEVVFNKIDSGPLTAITSPITLAECLVHPYRLGMTQLQNDFFDLIVIEFRKSNGTSSCLLFPPHPALSPFLGERRKVRGEFGCDSAFHYLCEVQ